VLAVDRLEEGNRDGVRSFSAKDDTGPTAQLHLIAILHSDVILLETSSGVMRWTHIVWDDTPGGNVEHVEEHDLTTDDVDYVTENYTSTGKSRSSDRDAVYGYTPDGRYIVVIYEEIDQDTVLAVTAYEVPEP
jgi:uncharacterized DUF497 family protein